MNTPLALIGPYTAFGLAFGTYIMKAFFEELPRELEEAARIDGATTFRIFWQIMLPLTRPALATISIFLFLQNWNEFLFALTFITESSMRTLPTGIYALLSSEFYGNYPIARRRPGALLAPVLVLYFIFQQQFIEGLTAAPSSTEARDRRVVRRRRHGAGGAFRPIGPGPQGAGAVGRRGGRLLVVLDRVRPRPSSRRPSVKRSQPEGPDVDGLRLAVEDQLRHAVPTAGAILNPIPLKAVAR